MIFVSFVTIEMITKGSYWSDPGLKNACERKYVCAGAHWGE